jgi:NAD(P)-dependent dehydrogenase (short-subunit alcohol dehydrogenase family)
MTDPWSLGAGLGGKGVVVTGSSGEIGREVARAFDAVRARLCVLDLREPPLDELRDPARRLGRVVDLRDIGSHEPILRDALAELGRLDVLGTSRASSGAGSRSTRSPRTTGTTRSTST